MASLGHSGRFAVSAFGKVANSGKEGVGRMASQVLREEGQVIGYWSKGFNNDVAGFSHSSSGGGGGNYGNYNNRGNMGNFGTTAIGASKKDQN